MSVSSSRVLGNTAGTTSAASNSAVPGVALVGAIRWDAWYDGTEGTVEQAVEKDLSPAQFHSRAPAFATVDAAGNLHINGNSQAEMSLEIQQAYTAGINYWAFDFYGSGSPMDNALSLYLNNPNNSLVNFCLTDTAGWGATSTNYQAAIDQRVALMTQPTYQRVDGGRPLYYLMLPSAANLAWWGNNPANLLPAVTYLRQQVEAKTGENPYVVIMGNPTEAAAWAQILGAEAISAYAIQGGDQGGSYQTLSNEALAGWNAEAGTGLSVIPTVMTGWDPSPRVLNPVPWGSDGTASYATATPAQIAGQLTAALNWVAAHPQDTANTALVYAWNEFDEGGWLAPTYVAGNPSGNTSRLTAVGQALTLARSGSVSRNPDGTYVSRLADGTVKYYSAAGVLTRIVNLDGTSLTCNADGTVSHYGASGKLTETDNTDGTRVLVASDGTRTSYSVTGQVTQVVYPDGMRKVVYPDGWLYYAANGTYLQHEVDAADGTRSFYNAQGGLTEIDYPNGSMMLVASNGTQTTYSASGIVTRIAGGNNSVSVSTGQSGVAITLGNGNDTVQAGNGGNVITVGNGQDVITLHGHANSVQLGSGTDTVDAATGDSIVLLGTQLTLIGGSAPTVFTGPGASSIDDRSSGLAVIVTQGSGKLSLTDLAGDPRWVIDLTGGVGGYKNAAGVLKALQSDGHGGSLLMLRNTPGAASIDFIGTQPSGMAVSHVKIG
jgi:hypothetical protein